MGKMALTGFEDILFEQTMTAQCFPKTCSFKSVTILEKTNYKRRGKLFNIQFKFSKKTPRKILTRAYYKLR